ncbi:hypothetical protein [Roseivirga thermotolerans]|uniref:hypothetical protein n=1 Tax=Roseivirga thermotolerans TaxID=1758176 RepID=UPI00273F5186|nr:hypothetical protein [Roseivirga thermotolerans]
MKTKNVLLMLLALLLFAGIASCDNDEGTTPEEDVEEDLTGEPQSWVLVDTDSFFVASATALPGGSGPFRYQINFATRAQLSQSNNDGGTASTFAIQLAFEARPTATGTFTFTNERITINTGELNLYQTFFVNTGHSREDKNYLSEGGTTVDVSIADGVLTSDLNALTMINEADDTDSFTLKWSLHLNW